jgi:uncharacterized surface protein with fasciclin (FAS1) repeats
MMITKISEVEVTVSRIDSTKRAIDIRPRASAMKKAKVAPTDAAFAAALEALGLSAEELLASPDLTNILLYHVAPGVFLAADVVAAAPIDALPTLLEGSTLAVAIVDGSVVINESATVIQADVVASNGVIHVIDAVLLP